MIENPLTLRLGKHLSQLGLRWQAILFVPLITANCSDSAPDRGISVREFKDCDVCPEMVVIPAGTFRMGDLSGGGGDDEKPVHEVRVGSFALGKYEVKVG